MLIKLALFIHSHRRSKSLIWLLLAFTVIYWEGWGSEKVSLGFPHGLPACLN